MIHGICLTESWTEGTDLRRFFPFMLTWNFTSWLHIWITDNFFVSYFLESGHSSLKLLIQITFRHKFSTSIFTTPSSNAADAKENLFYSLLSSPSHSRIRKTHKPWVQIVLFKLNWQKILIEMFAERKYLFTGFVSEKWFFICYTSAFGIRLVNPLSTATLELRHCVG